MARSRRIGLNPNAAVGEIEAAKGHEDIFAVEHPEQIGALHYKANAASLVGWNTHDFTLPMRFVPFLPPTTRSLRISWLVTSFLRAMSAPLPFAKRAGARPTLHCAVPVAAALFCLLLFFSSLFDLLDGLLNSGLRLKLPFCGLLSVRGCLFGVFRHLGGNALAGGVDLRAQLIVLFGEYGLHALGRLVRAARNGLSTLGDSVGSLPAAMDAVTYACWAP